MFINEKRTYSVNFISGNTVLDSKNLLGSKKFRICLCKKERERREREIEIDHWNI